MSDARLAAHNDHGRLWAERIAVWVIAAVIVGVLLTRLDARGDRGCQRTAHERPHDDSRIGRQRPQRRRRFESHTAGPVTSSRKGPVGWGITPFAGNWYISSKRLRTDGFLTTAILGLCPYKFVNLRRHFRVTNGDVTKNLGWRYVLPNPLFPFSPSASRCRTTILRSMSR
jgi:hypothetical protein